MKATRFLKDDELLARGWEALCRALGSAQAIRFLQRTRATRMDFTRERRRLFAGEGLDELLDALHQREQKK